MIRTIVFTLTSMLVSIQANAQIDRGDKLDQILNEVRDIRKRLEEMKGGVSSYPVSRLSVDTTGLPSIGLETAPFAIVEFFDYECSYCKEFHRTTFVDLKKHFIDTGKVRFYSVSVPSEKHSNGQIAAKASQCAAAQGEFWSLREEIRATPDEIGTEALLKYAAKTKMDMALFRGCMDSAENGDRGSRLKGFIDKGLQGTPSFVVGRNAGSVVSGELVTGAMPLGIFQRALQNVR
jgi:protein-disulfide isomerase